MSEALDWFKEWTFANQLVFQPEGHVGFARDCVGILDEGHYLDVEYQYSSDAWDLWEVIPWDQRRDNPELQTMLNDIYAYLREPRLHPRDRAPDAYHKYDCLAVIGRGDHAINQLYAWTRGMVDDGAFVERTPVYRIAKPSSHYSLFPRSRRTRLTFTPYEEQYAKVTEMLKAVKV